jgi:predicted RNA binding protein YcfA (HicA-like mRNA interferase family)
MPKLPVVTPLKLIKVLEVFGFVYVGGSGSHKVMKHIDGKRTTVPMHSKDIPKGTLLAILRDMEISKDELIMALKKL